MLKEAPKSLHPSGAPGGQAPEYAASRELNGEGEPAVALSQLTLRLPLPGAVQEYQTSLWIGPADGQPVPGNDCGVPVVAATFTNGCGPLALPQWIGVSHESLAGGVLVTVKAWKSSAT